jgi:hypothetical protein
MELCIGFNYGIYIWYLCAPHSKQNLDRIVDSIINLQIPNFEIIICGSVEF